jgi:hypothetical protein
MICVMSVLIIRTTVICQEASEDSAAEDYGNIVLTKDDSTGKTDSSPMLAGVIFYQEQISETRKILRCHFTNSLYRHAIDAIVQTKPQ